MKYFLFFLSVAFSGCGEEYRCIHENEFEVQGLCVNTGGLEGIEPEYIEMTQLIIRKQFRNHYGMKLPKKLYLDNNIVVFFLEDARMECDHLYAAGCNIIPNHIIYAERNDVWPLKYSYSILAHEIFHSIAYEILDASIERNIDHTVPGMFYQWVNVVADTNEEKYEASKTTLEWDVFNDIYDYFEAME